MDWAGAATGYSVSVYLMVGLPYLMLATIGSGMWWLIRRAERESDATGTNAS